MTKHKQLRKLTNVDKEIDEDELVNLVQNCKLEYPHLPDIVIHCACVDYLLNPNKKQFKYKTDSEYNKIIEAVKNEYDNKKYVHEGVSILEEVVEI